MTDDLSTRLLAAIDVAEVAARSCEDEVGGERTGDMYSDNSGEVDRDAFPSYPWGSMDRELRFMAGPGHPQSVLRLCQAHREIVELAMVCRADAALATEGLERCTDDAEAAGRFLMQAGANEALARMQLSQHYLTILAHGYGIEA